MFQIEGLIGGASVFCTNGWVTQQIHEFLRIGRVSQVVGVVLASLKSAPLQSPLPESTVFCTEIDEDCGHKHQAQWSTHNSLIA
eukprot:295138-Amphidinium_carterae.1